VLADPLSGVRFGDHVARDDVTVCGRYDAYLDAPSAWAAPDLVVRVGASPTSKALRHYLRDRAERQVVVDAAGEWSEATFTATDHLVADPTRLASRLLDRLEDAQGAPAWRRPFERAEAVAQDVVDEAAAEDAYEGAVLSAVTELAPDPATLFVSNSMPVRDFDRFGAPRAAALTALGNRGASGIDGITSTGLGAGSATTEPLVIVTGDLAYYHDMNGLLAIARCAVDATIVLVNNDGGGIFHALPIESFDPPFTELFKTPHGMDFEPTGDLYDLSFQRVDPGADFRSAFAEAAGSEGTQVLEVAFDAETSHRTRERLHERVCDRVASLDH
jgi:2-succinyl-5-enolpyruvyl-6-hydroxy-3-cyclohexene-1-carboxylate synthase